MTKRNEQQHINDPCSICPLRNIKDLNYVPPEIPPNPKVLIVGEAPGEHEVEIGRPFVGRAGQLLNYALIKAGFLSSKEIAEAQSKYPQRIKYREIGIANVVCCRPPKNQTPTVEIIRLCQTHLFDLIDRVKPRMIICLGNIARYPFLGVKVGINAEHGRVIEHQFDWGKAFIGFTFHPASVLHKSDPSLLTKIIVDLKRFKRILQFGLRYDHLDSFHIYDSIDEIEELMKTIESLPIDQPVAVDIEVTGLSRFENEILSIAFCWEPRISHVIYLADLEPSDRAIAFKLIERIMRSDRIKIGNNVVFDAVWLRSRGIEVNNFIFDNMLIHQVINPDWSHGLKAMVRQFTNFADYGIDFKKIGEIPKEELCKYNAIDASFSLQMAKLFNKKIMGSSKLPNLVRMLSAVVQMLQDVHMHGINIDLSALHGLREDYKRRIAEIEEKLKEISGDPDFNPRSHEQVRKLLFDKLGLEPVKMTDKGNASIDRASLLQLNHEAAHLIERHRHYTKMISTYLDGLENQLIDGKFYPEFRITGDESDVGRGGTVSGRLTSTLHTFPSHGEDAVIKRCFVSSFPNGYILECDLSQIELRVAAFYSRDPLMLKYYREGKDLHRLTASRLFNVSEEEVTKEQRQTGKTCVAEGMLVFTSEGLKPIEYVRIGDRVWTGYRYAKVRDIRYMGRKQVYRVKARFGYEIELTDDHEMLILSPDGSMKFKQVSDLRPDDFVIISMPTESCSDAWDIRLISRGWAPLVIEDIEPLDIKHVYDLEVDAEEHQFVCQGFIISNCNFSIIYGISPKGLVSRFRVFGVDIDEDRAEEFIETFFETYPGIRRFHERIDRIALERKRVMSVFGRVRYLEDAFEVDRGYALRFAKNFVIQSTASDIALMATLKLHNVLQAKGFKSRIIGMKHDSVILDVSPDEKDDVIEIVADCFRNPPIKVFFPDVDFDVPLDCGIAIGPNWFDVEEIEI